MRYSCFDAAGGSYRYFEDNAQLAINSDLPVPSLPRSAGRVGVPARESGRPLPRAAKEVGRGFFATGVIVNCRSGSSALGQLSESGRRDFAIGVAVASLAVGAYVFLIRKKS